MNALQTRANEILKRLPRRATMAEIGVRNGSLSKALLDERPGLHLYAVDNWLPAKQRPGCYVKTGDICAAWTKQEAEQAYRQASLIYAEYGHRAVVIRDDSVSAASTIRDESLDLVFLDGDHSEHGVARDIEAWISKVEPGGWIGGHDYGNPDPRFDFGVKAAVDQFFSHVELGGNYTWWVRV